MCLGIPGRLLEVYQQDDLPMGKVDFDGIVKETCLAYTPEAQVGDYVLVHVGFAISRIDEEEAEEIFSCINEIAEAAGLKRQTTSPVAEGEQPPGEAPPEAPREGPP